MNISKINLVNFRNYSKLSINLGQNMNIFIGNNAQGKTNILESIMFLALTKSPRVFNESDLIKYGLSKAIVKGKVKDNNSIREMEISLEKGKKSLSINKTPIKKLSSYISNLIIISFTPDDLNIIKSSPSIRRNVLNVQISQLSKVYLNTYNEYNKLLKVRNEYLKVLFTNSIADKNYFDVITEKLIEKAVIIYQIRKEYIDMINLSITDIYDDIDNSKAKISMKYEPNVEILDYDTNKLSDTLKNIFKTNYRKELNNGVTLFGPHRDDFSFYLDEKNLKIYGSQGQQKLAVLAYKLSEVPIFIDKCNSTPVLLFDDIFSELDIKKRNGVLKYVQRNIQTIITTTDLKNIQKKYLKEAFIFEVKEGKIININYISSLNFRIARQVLNCSTQALSFILIIVQNQVYNT